MNRITYAVTLTVHVSAHAQSEALTILEKRIVLGVAVDPHLAMIVDTHIKAVKTA